MNNETGIYHYGELLDVENERFELFDYQKQIIEAGYDVKINNLEVRGAYYK